MGRVSQVLVGLVALEHVYILVLEMFLWTSPRALRVFDMTLEVAQTCKTLAANQGLYNGFLAAGLVWALLHSNATLGRQLAFFFLGCVLVAAIVGGVLVKLSILLVQGLPALVALLSLFLFRKAAKKTQTSGL